MNNFNCAFKQLIFKLTVGILISIDQWRVKEVIIVCVCGGGTTHYQSCENM